MVIGIENKMNKKLLDYGFDNPVRRKEKMKRKEVPKFDVTPYVGTKAEIVLAEVRKSKFGECIYIETNTIPLNEGDELPEDKQLKASKILGLMKDKDGEFYIGIDSKADKFLVSHKVNIDDLSDDLNVGDRIEALEGLKVVCQKNDNGFLEIA